MPTTQHDIDVGRDFSEVPGGRFPEDGPFNGQLFRETVLVPALRDHQVVCVTLDNTDGFGSSFLDEAFAGMIREGYFTREELRQRLLIRASKPSSLRYLRKIEEYMDKAKRSK